ncbi:MAG: hypothetical protein L0323_23930 [Planctomycetes bacterium]|nr:hypothetical protein [Planctomycetota bacterium]
MKERARLADLATLVLLADLARQSAGADLDEVGLARGFWALRRHLPDAADLLVSIGAGRFTRGQFHARRMALRKTGMFLGRLARWLSPDPPGPHLRTMAAAVGIRTLRSVMAPSREATPKPNRKRRAPARRPRRKP